MKSCYPLYILISLVFFISCQEEVDPLAHVTDAKAKAIIEKGWNSIGGWERYQSLQHIKYNKRAVLYHTDGSGRLESDVQQVHEYQLQPTLSGTITSEDSSGVLQVVYNGDEAYKTLNGEKIEGSELSAERTFLSAHFVLFSIFKMADPGVGISYVGTASTDMGYDVQVVKVDYDPSTQDNHSTDDTWYMDFDATSGSYNSNMIYHAPTYNFIENNETTQVDGMTFNTYRKSWRTDGERKKEYLRGEFWYSDYELTFDE